MLPSKVYESYILNWVQTEVKLRDTQYGGVKGCSTAHLLVGVWDEVMRGLEDDRAAVMLTAIDYAKAFNRLSFQHCLKSFASKGASTQILELLATFLSNRTMTVRVGASWSAPRPVNGGVPQGSILGVFLYNMATDDLGGLESEENREEERDLDSTPEIQEEGENTGQESSPPVTQSLPRPWRRPRHTVSPPMTRLFWAGQPLWEGGPNSCPLKMT